MASHDLNFNVTQNGMQQPPSYDQQQMQMQGQMQGSMDYGMNSNPNTMMSSGNSVGSTGSGGSSGMLARIQAESAHPMACIFHFAFKAAAMFLYIFGGWFTRGPNGKTSGAKFVTVMVCCILLLAADFWVVKNITGRLLVGLRWWNKVEGDTTTWIFECADTLPNGTTIQRNQFDKTMFWSVLYITPLLWGGLLFIGILKFELGWLIIVFMALGMSMANVYGYYKCSNDQKAKFQQMMQEGAQQGAMAMMRHNMLGVLTGATGAAGAQNTNTYT